MGYKIVMYTMNNCSLCEKAKRLLDLWGYTYKTVNAKPYFKRPYPYFYINGKMVEYEKLVDMIAKEKI